MSSSRRNKSSVAAVLAAVCLLALGLAAQTNAPSTPEAALKAVSAENILKHIKVLASDEFEGRAPGSKGEELTVKYLTEQFRALGLAPGNPDGTFVQKVSMVEITADPKMKLAFSGAAAGIAPKYQDDYVAWTKRVTESVAMDADMIFVGYGVQAPEFQWNDFKGVDVTGKLIVVLVNDPPVADEKVFGGKAMTYYGRWTYKFEKAAEKGAAGCLIIHETGPAGYPWQVVRNSWGRGQFDLATPDKNMGRAAVEGWMTWELAEKLFKAAGKDLAVLKQAAVSRNFKPVPLGLRAKLDIKNTLRMVDSKNVIARLAGSDAKLKDEYVIYCAHWDHFGIGPEVKGDKIYNGAVDNASGTAALLEMARAYKQLASPPRRSILFLAVTGEEQGLLGSAYYAKRPLYPLARTAAAVNMDAMNVLGKTRDIISVGLGSSTLDEIVIAEAKAQGRVVKPDAEPEKGFFYRSDHFPFSKEGVPAFDPGEGTDFIGKPAGWGMKMREKYTQEDYHKPSDEVKPDWDLSGLVQDAQLYFMVGYRVANDAKMPEWKPGTEFKAKREASLKAATEKSAPGKPPKKP
ncbi:MAG: M28 family peptidase [Acidobacteria bacterium]|nr:M28 family peptidase [Acidobacteriota bacterium]